MSNSKRKQNKKQPIEVLGDMQLTRKQSIEIISRNVNHYHSNPELTVDWRPICVHMLNEMVTDINNMLALEQLGEQEYRKMEHKSGFSHFNLFIPRERFRGSLHTMHDYHDMYDIVVAKYCTIFLEDGNIKGKTFKNKTI